MLSRTMGVWPTARSVEEQTELMIDGMFFCGSQTNVQVFVAGDAVSVADEGYVDVKQFSMSSSVGT